METDRRNGLSEKAIVVTGAGGALGGALVRALIERGSCVIAGDIDADRARRACAGLNPTRAVPITADVSTHDGASKLTHACLDSFGTLDGLINNAAIAPAEDESIESVNSELWIKVLRVNLVGSALCLAAAVPHLQGGGTVVNIASFAALVGSSNPQPAYAASKGGLVSFTREAAVALASRGIRVNAVCPGPLETPLLPSALQSDEAARRRRFDRIPLARFGTADDVVPTVLFLLSPDAAYISGAVVPVDGGITAAYLASAD